MILFYVLAIVIGIIMALQGGVNSELSRGIQSDLWATIVGFFLGLFALLLIALATQQTFSLKKALVVSPQYYLGGLMGAAIVLSLVFLFPKIGAVNIVIFTVLGQMICSLVIDHYGWFNAQVSAVNWERIAALGLMVIAVIWFQKSRV